MNNSKLLIKSASSVVNYIFPPSLSPVSYAAKNIFNHQNPCNLWTTMFLQNEPTFLLPQIIITNYAIRSYKVKTTTIYYAKTHKN